MDERKERLHVGRTLKIGSHHVGGAFTDILLTAVWNRILISNLGLPATPVAILSALRYFLAPLSIWSGSRSDTHPIMGKYRLPYIWGGRALVVLGLLLIPPATLQLAASPTSWLGWLLATLCFVIAGAGTLIAGSPYLALIRDRTAPSKRGQALAIAQIMLLFAFSLSPAIYAAMLKQYDAASLWRAVLVGVALATPFWFFSVLGEDKRTAEAEAEEEHQPIGVTMRAIWADSRARTFFIFLGLGMVSVFAQDAILEPFGADVFGLDVAATTKWNAFWGLGVLVGMIVTAVATRKRVPHAHKGTTQAGITVTAAALALLAIAAGLKLQPLLLPVLILFGFGFGIQTFGTINLLMAMTSDKHAGAYLGLWSLAQLVFRGVGMALGGMLRDGLHVLSGSFAVTYGAIFLLEAVGLAICLSLLASIDVEGFAAGRPAQPLEALAAADS
jgi:BCD family chlorophyll transporter-like MFS transporter